VRPGHTLTVLFDLDDTLFDHESAARRALADVHSAHAQAQHVAFDEFERAHTIYLEELHHDVVAGTRGIDEARIERFRRLFASIGVGDGNVDLPSAAARYRTAYLTARRPMEGALELLTALKPLARIGIVTNNLLEEQQDKVRLCGFDAYVDALVASEEAGVSKPDPEIFRIALERLGSHAADAVMIGDSWTTDIAGAIAAGIRPIWFNRHKRQPPDRDVAIAILTALTPVGAALDLIAPELCSADRD